MSTILIVDDQPLNLYLLNTILAPYQHKVLEAANGVEALALARHTLPDLIISDILMPQMDGFALCHAVKDDEHLKDIPFIFYTATYTDPRDEALALQLGAARFITKPIESQKLIVILNEVLQEQVTQPLARPAPLLEEETIFYRLYNEALIRKLEDKMLALEQSNHRLSESEERFRRLAENAQDLIYRYELIPARGFSYVSPAAAALTGYSPEEYYANPDLDFRLILPDDCPAWEIAVHGASPPGQALTMRWVRKDGQVIWTEQRLVFTFNATGERTAIEGIVRDITERKQREQELETITEETRRQMRQLQALRTIDNAITASHDLTSSLNVLLEQTLSQLNGDAAAVLLYQPLTLSLNYVARCGFHSSCEQILHLQLGEGITGRAALERQTLYTPQIEPYQVCSTCLPIIVEEGFICYAATPLICEKQLKGVLEVFQRRPFQHDDNWLTFFEALAQQAAIAIDRIQLFEKLQLSNQELLQAYDATIEGWSRALDLRDKETEGHTLRVVEMTLTLARAVGIPEEEMIHVRRGALLHDIGKMGIPDIILLKPDRLSEEEWTIMRKHPQYAYDMLQDIAHLRPALEIPYCHHEKWDGSGYPRGLKEEQIPLSARLFAIVDVWDALTSDRPYRKAWSREQACEYLRQQSGRHFDPQITELFLNLLIKLAREKSG